MKTRTYILSMFIILAAFCLTGLNWTPAQSIGSPPDPCPPNDADPGENCNGEMLQYRAASVSPTATGGPDRFGYTWDDSWTQTWIDATSGGTRLWSSGTPDNDVFGPVELGFSFPFYETKHNNVYIGTNGLLGFDLSIGEKSASAMNLRIPLDYEYPQAFIAPFWCNMKDGQVWYKKDPAGSYFVVEWYQMSHYEPGGGTLTFEVILYKDGDIVTQYYELTDPPPYSTIGMEDMDGVSGLLYSYNVDPSALEGKAILLDRPTQSSRVKAFPIYQSAFNINGLSIMQVRLRNVGDLDNPIPEDMINIQTSSSDAGWEVDLYTVNGSTPLTDHDADLLPDTDTLPQGETFTATVKITSPTSAPIGASTTISLTASSSNDPDKKVAVQLVSAIPGPFSQMSNDQRLLAEESGYTIELFSPQIHRLTQVNQGYNSAAIFSLNDISNGRFLGLWEMNVGMNSGIDYLMVDGMGQKLSQNPVHLTDSTLWRDTQPMAVTAPDGKIGVTWIRKDDNVQNVYFGIRDAGNTQFLYGGVKNVTGNPTPSLSEIYQNPTICATDNNYFHLAWVETVSTPSKTNEIGHAVFHNSLTPVTKGRLTVPKNKVNYADPSAVCYQGISNVERVLLGYIQKDSRVNPLDPTYNIVYGVLNSDGDVYQAQGNLYSGIHGSGLDGIQMSDGRIALAWTDRADDRIQYAILGQDLSIPVAPTKLSQADDQNGWRQAGAVSVTRDNSGHAILTWLEVSFLQRLYYALIGDNGTNGIVTQPMVFKYAMPGGIAYLQSRVARSNAIYEMQWLSFLPLVRK